MDAVGVWLIEAGTTNLDIGLYSDPAGTPTPMTNGVVSVDPQIFASASNRFYVATLPEEVELSAGTQYAMGVKQNSATNITLSATDVAAAPHWQANGLTSTCYAATSTAGAAFSQLVSGTRRAAIYARVSSLDDGAGGGGGGMLYRAQGTVY